MENRFGNLLSIMLIVAIVIVIGILSFFGYKVYTSNKTNKEAEDVVSQFDKNTEDNNTDSSNNNSSETEGNNSSLQDILDNLGNDSGNSIYQQQGNKDTYYEGYKVIGTISIPSIDVEYPILEENTSATLKIAIVAVYPQDPANAVNKPGNLVLWGASTKKKLRLRACSWFTGPSETCLHR